MMRSITNNKKWSLHHPGLSNPRATKYQPPRKGRLTMEQATEINGPSPETAALVASYSASLAAYKERTS